MPLGRSLTSLGPTSSAGSAELGGQQRAGHPTSARDVSPESCGDTVQVIVGLTSLTREVGDQHSVPDLSPCRERASPLCSILHRCNSCSCTPTWEEQAPPGPVRENCCPLQTPPAAIRPPVTAGSRTPLALGFGSFSNLLKAMTALTIPQRRKMCRGISSAPLNLSLHHGGTRRLNKSSFSAPRAGSR